MISMTSDKMQGWKIKFILRTERKRKRELNYLSVTVFVDRYWPDHLLIMLSIYSDSIEGQLYSKAFHMNKIYIYIYVCVCVCDSWGGRSVLGKTVPEVLDNDQGIQTNLGWWITFLFFILIFLDKNKTKQNKKKQSISIFFRTVIFPNLLHCRWVTLALHLHWPDALLHTGP